MATTTATRRLLIARRALFPARSSHRLLRSPSDLTPRPLTTPLLPARGHGKTAGGIRRGRSEAETERPRPALPSAWAGPLAASWGGWGGAVLEK